LLSDADVDRIATTAVHLFRQLRDNNSFGMIIKYAGMLVAGLLRVRERDRWALLAERSGVADAPHAELGRVLAQIQARQSETRNYVNKEVTIQERMLFLSGEGGRPDILVIIEKIAED
jgi:hypothetical protein